MSGTLAAYYRLSKPGIIRGNLITAVAAYLYGANRHIVLSTLLGLSIGTSLIIASGCVFNNIIDSDIDAMMSRTKHRELVVGVISKLRATIYGIVLGITGALVLFVWTNMLTLVFGVIGFVTYVWIYTYAKRTTHLSTLIGTIPGATPPVAGYLAATNHLDITSVLFFAVLLSWQMPHFLAIAIRRIDEYRAAGIPLLPIVKGVRHTKLQIRLYIVMFLIVTSLFSIQNDTVSIYALGTTSVGLAWVYMAVFQKKMSDVEWAKRVFLCSLIALLVFDVCIVLSRWI